MPPSVQGSESLNSTITQRRSWDVQLNEQALFREIGDTSSVLSQRYGNTVHVVELDRVRGLV